MLVRQDPRDYSLSFGSVMGSDMPNTRTRRISNTTAATLSILLQTTKPPSEQTELTVVGSCSADGKTAKSRTMPENSAGHKGTGLAGTSKVGTTTKPCTPQFYLHAKDISSTPGHNEFHGEFENSRRAFRQEHGPNAIKRCLSCEA